MTTQQMEYFLSLAQKLNFSAVAERFFISQPTLSRQISNMERELNAQLFIRKNNTVYLTRAGEQLYAGLKNIYGNFQDLARQVEDLGRSRAGQLHIGVAEEQQISGQLLAAVRKLHQERPDVQITIRRCLYGPTAQRLAGRRFGPHQRPGLSRGSFFERHDVPSVRRRTASLGSIRATGGSSPQPVDPGGIGTAASPCSDLTAGRGGIRTPERRSRGRPGAQHELFPAAAPCDYGQATGRHAAVCLRRTGRSRDQSDSSFSIGSQHPDAPHHRRPRLSQGGGLPHAGTEPTYERFCQTYPYCLNHTKAEPISSVIIACFLGSVQLKFRICHTKFATAHRRQELPDGGVPMSPVRIIRAGLRLSPVDTSLPMLSPGLRLSRLFYPEAHQQIHSGKGQHAQEGCGVVTPRGGLKRAGDQRPMKDAGMAQQLTMARLVA